MFSKYPIDSISRKLEDSFPDVDFRKIKKMNDIFKSKRNNANKYVKSIFNIILAISSIILNFIPEAVVISFDYDYTEFKVKVFWITLGVTIYIGFLLVVGLRVFKRDKILMNYINDVLNYVVIKNESNNAN